MRVRVEMFTRAQQIPWKEVLRPGRGIVYDLLAETAPELGKRLHTQGIGRFGLAPFGHSAPRFPDAPKRRGIYSAGGDGVVEFSSPVPEVVEALASGLGRTPVLDWGGVALQRKSVDAQEPPEFTEGRGILRTVTPVLVKGPPRRNEQGQPLRTQRWLLPGEPEWDVYLLRNLRRKAAALDLDPDVNLDAVLRIGSKQSYAVGQGAKIGAEVDVALSGAPETLQALWSWGLGVATSAGFGAVAV